jgi:hypothetical protein
MSENPQNLTTMAIENPPVVAPQMTGQEQSVLYGETRSKLKDAATMAGAMGGVVTGAIIGGIWSAVTGGQKWLRKTAGVAAVVGVVGALIGRAGMDKNADDIIANAQAQNMTPGLEGVGLAAPPHTPEEIVVGAQTNKPSMLIDAATTQLQTTASQRMNLLSQF